MEAEILHLPVNRVERHVPLWRYDWPVDMTNVVMFEPRVVRRVPIRDFSLLPPADGAP